MSKSSPKISIITVSYNDVEGLVQTMSSVTSQTFKDYEWIVIDGGSEDGTVNVLKAYDQDNLRWVSEKDSGIYDAMNKGMAMSEGEYVVFLNAGDTFPDNDTLAQVGKKLLDTTGMAILFGGAEYIFPDGKAVYRPPKNAAKCIWHGLPANHQATYYGRELLEGFRYDPTYKICGDYYIIATLSRKRFDAKYLNQSLVRFEVGGASYMNRKRLFWEPYLIQRDVLHQPIILRLLSMLKRGISTLGMVVLNNIHGGRK